MQDIADNMKSININEIKNLGDINIIDVREPAELMVGSIDGSKNIPMMGLMMNASNFLNQNETYYIYCAAGGRSFNVCQQLSSQGFDVVNLEGGFGSYQM